MGLVWPVLVGAENFALENARDRGRKPVGYGKCWEAFGARGGPKDIKGNRTDTPSRTGEGLGTASYDRSKAK